MATTSDMNSSDRKLYIAAENITSLTYDMCDILQKYQKTVEKAWVLLIQILESLFLHTYIRYIRYIYIYFICLTDNKKTYCK